MCIRDSSVSECTVLGLKLFLLRNRWLVISPCLELNVHRVVFIKCVNCFFRPTVNSIYDQVSFLKRKFYVLFISQMMMCLWAMFFQRLWCWQLTKRQFRQNENLTSECSQIFILNSLCIWWQFISSSFSNLPEDAADSSYFEFR